MMIMMMFVSNIFFWEFNEITPFLVEENHQLFHVVRLIHFIAESNKIFFLSLLKSQLWSSYGSDRVIW